MPRVSGKALISETTEKIVRRTVFIASVSILTKLYDVPLNDLNVLGMKLPAALFDTVLMIMVVYHVYSLTINWIGDLAAFRLWYVESSIWDMFGSNMRLDKDYIRGAIPLMLRLYQLEKNDQWPVNFAQLTDDEKKQYNEFKTNVELYTARLEYAGIRFSALTWFGRYYVWIQSYIFPIIICIIAIYLLSRYGTFSFPMRI